MKMADVVSVRDASPDAHPAEAASAARERIASLLRRYPNTSEAQNAEILRFLATGPHLDVGLIGGDDELAPKVQAFRNAHARHFRLTVWEAALFLAATFGILALFVLEVMPR